MNFLPVKCRWTAAVICSLAALTWGCETSSGDGDGGAEAGSMAGSMAGSTSGAEGGGAGEGGAGGEVMRTLAEDRCDMARSKVEVLALYPDRLEAFRQDELGWRVSHHCSFLALYEEGVTSAKGVAEGEDGAFAVVYDAGEAGGGVLIYDNNGALTQHVEPNINLISPAGIWWVEEGYVVWSSMTKNLYKLSAEGSVMGTYNPPMQVSARLENLTDLLYLGRDDEMNPRLLATFSDRPPQLFAFPDSPSFDEGDINGAWGMTLVSTQIGDKIAFTGEVEGSRGGVIQYRPVISGRQAPDKEDVLIYATDEGYGNGADITTMDDGFFILDTSSESGPQISSFNSFGILQERSSLEEHGAPIELLRTRIFKDL